MKYIYRYLWLAPIFVLIQIFFLNNIDFLQYINPFLYLVLIITMPQESPRWFLIIYGLYIGILLDIDPINPQFGTNSSILVFIGFIKPYLQKLIVPKKLIDEKSSLNLRNLGIRIFSMLSLSIILIHNTCLFLLEYFTSFNLFLLLTKVIISSLTTYIIILISQLFTMKKKK